MKQKSRTSIISKNFINIKKDNTLSSMRGKPTKKNQIKETPKVNKKLKENPMQKLNTPKRKAKIIKNISQEASDSDDVSLVNSTKIKGENEDEKNEEVSSIGSSMTLGLESEEEIDLQPQIKKIKKSMNSKKPTKKMLFIQLKEKEKEMKIELKEELDNKIENKSKFQTFFNTLKSIKRSKFHKKYNRTIIKTENLENTTNSEGKTNLFSSLFQTDIKKRKMKAKLLNKMKTPKKMLEEIPLNELLEKKKKEKVEIFLDEQLEGHILDEDEISLNETPPPTQIQKKRKRRTKKEMELFKVLKKAMSSAKEPENENEDDETEKKEETNNIQPTPEKKRKKRRTKKEMEVYRARQAQLESEKKLVLQKELSENQNNQSQSENGELDDEFHKNDTKNEFIEMINQIPNSLDNSEMRILKQKKKLEKIENQKKERSERKERIEKKKLERKEMKEKLLQEEKERKKLFNSEKKTDNPDFEDFLGLDLGKSIKTKKKRKIYEKKQISSKKKLKNSKLLDEEWTEKVKTRRKTGGLIYYATNFQKWVKVTDENPKTDEKIAPIKDFEGTPGIKLSSLNYTNNPYDFFSQYVPEFMYEEIAKFTNISATLSKYFKNKQWNECNAQEIKDLFALFFLFELIKKNNLADYWTDDPLLHVSSVEKIMSEDRFFSFKKLLSFYDKSKKLELEKENDPFYKCKFLINHIREACSNIYIPEKNLILQEVLLNYAGITKIDSFDTRKQRGKNEINIAVLREATSGYVWNILLNEGNKLFEKKQLLNIINGLEYKGYILYMDSIFVSPNILVDLKTRHFGACGMISVKRLKPPTEIKNEIDAIDKPGGCGFFKNKDLTVAVWNHYQRKVFGISNFHDCDIMTIKKSRKIGYFSKVQYKIYEYEAPRLINEIIENLKGNDYLSKIINYFSLDYNSWKWYYRVLHYFLEISMMNSYLVYVKALKQKHLTPISNLEYRVEIIKSLCKWSEKINNPNRFEKENIIEKVENNFKENEEKHEELVFDDIILTNNCKLVYIGVGFCDYCRKKRHKLKKTLFWCKECQYGLCVKCYDQHKIDQIFKRMKTLDPIYNKNLFDLLIFNQNLQATETISDVNKNGFMKRFRRSKKQLNVLRKTKHDNKPNQENHEKEEGVPMAVDNENNKQDGPIDKPINPLKRKRKPYRKRKNKLNIGLEKPNKNEINNDINNLKKHDPISFVKREKAKEEEKVKTLERDLFKEALFEFSDDSKSEKIKKKPKILDDDDDDMQFQPIMDDFVPINPIEKKEQEFIKLNHDSDES